MKNIYALVNERIITCKKDEDGYLRNLQEYFIYFLIPSIIDNNLSGIDFNNYESYKNLELISIRRKINIFSLDDGLIEYDGHSLRINSKLLKYFKYLIDNFLRDNKLGKIYDIDDYNTLYFEIDTSLDNLIKVYNKIIQRLQVKDLEDYENKIDVYSSGLDSLYSEEICSRYFYGEFLNRIYLIIMNQVNSINILNYRDFNIHKEVVDSYFYLRTKGESIKLGSSLDINLDLYILRDYEGVKALNKLIKQFLSDYNLGDVDFDGSLRININTTLDNLIYAYYMEMQRLEYLTNDIDQPKIIVRK